MQQFGIGDELVRNKFLQGNLAFDRFFQIVSDYTVGIFIVRVLPEFAEKLINVVFLFVEFCFLDVLLDFDFFITFLS